MAQTLLDLVPWLSLVPLRRSSVQSQRLLAFGVALGGDSLAQITRQGSDGSL